MNPGGPSDGAGWTPAGGDEPKHTSERRAEDASHDASFPRSLSVFLSGLTGRSLMRSEWTAGR